MELVNVGYFMIMAGRGTRSQDYFRGMQDQQHYLGNKYIDCTQPMGRKLLMSTSLHVMTLHVEPRKTLPRSKNILL